MGPSRTLCAIVSSNKTRARTGLELRSSQLTRRIPSLDGLRAVSIALVIAWHSGFLGFGLRRLDYGNLGVRIFFLISGFLITGILLEQLASSGRIDLRTFYVRRIARIIPAYWCFLVTVALLVPTGLVAAHYPEFLAALLYYSNYVHVGVALIATWSLSVEEQFYLLWPLTLLLLGPIRARVACLLVLLLAPTFRILAHLDLWPSEPRYAFECVCDALATGCLLALLRDYLWGLPVYRRLVQSGTALLFVPAILLIQAAFPGSLIYEAVGLSALNLGLAAAIDVVMRRPTAWPGRLLNMRPLVWIGTLSYSLYLWQQPFMGARLPLVLKLGAILACACASYYLVERPLRRRLNAHWRPARSHAEPLSGA